MLPGRPEDPEMRESASIWLYEEGGTFGFPRHGLEAVGNVWENHRFDCNFALGVGGFFAKVRGANPIVDRTGRALKCPGRRADIVSVASNRSANGW